jgi:arsenite/tail-anchored protein-transporting ATPase
LLGAPLPLGRQRIVFVGGKGGVGKTTTASTIALHLAERGERVLLVSTDPAHNLGDLFDTAIGDRERGLAPNLWALEIDPEAQVEQHLAAVLKSMRGLVSPEMFPEIERQMQLTRLSPGAVEAAMLERVAELMIDGSRRFDRVVFDTAPTGHTLRLISLPEVMAAWTDGLLRHRDRSDAWGRVLKRMRAPGSGDDLSYIDQARDDEPDERSRRIRETLMERRRKFYQARKLLLDPAVTGFVWVLVPEKLPILETRKALEALGSFDVPIVGLVVNRVLPAGALGEFLEKRREQEGRYLRQIDDLFGRWPRVRIPLLARDVEGVASLREVSRPLLGGG